MSVAQLEISSELLAKVDELVGADQHTAFIEQATLDALEHSPHVARSRQERFKLWQETSVPMAWPDAPRQAYVEGQGLVYIDENGVPLTRQEFVERWAARAT